MIDARFSDVARWYEQRTSNLRDAESVLAELGDRDALICRARARIVAASADEPSEDGILGPPQLLQLWMRDGPSNVAPRDPAALLFVLALAHEGLARVGNVNLLANHGEKLARAPQWLIHAFDVECAALIARGDDGDRRVWMEALATSPPRAGRSERPLHGGPNAEAAGTPFHALQVRSSSEIVMSYAPERILAVIDRRAWLDAVERWPVDLASGVFFDGELRYGRELGLSLLAVATPVFDAAGRWNGHVGVPFLIRELLQHGRDLSGELRRANESEDERARAIEDFSRVELPSFLGRMLEVVIARTDGRQLLAAFDEHIRWALIDARGARDRTQVEGVCALALLDAARRLEFTPDELRQHWRARHGDTVDISVDRAASAIPSLLLAADLHVGRQGAASIWNWIRDSLLSRDSGWVTLVDRTELTRECAVLASALFQIDGFTEQWAIFYDALEAQRRRAEFSLSVGDRDAEVASVALLRLGAAAHAFAAEGAPTDFVLDQFWFAVDSRARRLALTGREGASERSLGTHELMFGWLAHLPDAVLARLLPGALAPHLDDPVRLALAVVKLGEARSIANVDAACLLAGTSRDALAKRAHDWAVATGLPVDARVAAAIAAFGVRADNDAAPTPPRHRRP